MTDEQLKVQDPARYRAKQEGIWLVKEYSHEIGCTDVKYGTECEANRFWLMKWIQQRLENIPQNMRDGMYYRMFDATGRERSVQINWIQEIIVDD